MQYTFTLVTILLRFIITVHFVIDIRVRDTGALQDIAQLTITITDENDNTPTFSQNEFNVTLQDNLLVGTNVVMVPASDLDSSGPMTYTLIGAEGNMYFQINSVGLVTVKVPVNLKNNDVITFTVTAADGGVPEQTATTTVNVLITDVNENRPVFDQGFYNFQVRDDADIGQSVGTIHATDMDTGMYTSLMCFINDCLYRYNFHNDRFVSFLRMKHISCCFKCNLLVLHRI